MMSHTDKTRPFWVKMLDSVSNYTEHHDHRDGVCDLPDAPSGPGSFAWKGRGCCYTWTSAFIYSGQARCGCPMCQDSVGQRDAVKRRRSSARASARTWARQFNTDGEIADW